MYLGKNCDDDIHFFTPFKTYNGNEIYGYLFI